MLNSIRQKQVFVTAFALFLAGALSAMGAETENTRQLAKVKRQPDGTVSLKQVANYNDYQDDKDYHAQLQNLTDPAAIAALKAKHGQLNILQEFDGGILKGTVEIGSSVVTFDVTGGGSLAGFHHVFTMPASFEVHSAPNDPRQEIDSFATNMYRIEGRGSDDVFESIHLIGGTGNGYPSPGQMTFISKGKDVLVDSFFNIGFRLEIQGAKGGPFDGFSDAVVGKVTMRSQAAAPAAPASTKPSVAKPTSGEQTKTNR
ncbi:MAG TPA: hypothetical protein VGS07_17115 [Thermoanaerobaculia bacterium]|jgi:hypothetical protein|nr:hypothetical protein [Thermoanaerobaculia bacterium]